MMFLFTCISLVISIDEYRKQRTKTIHAIAIIKRESNYIQIIWLISNTENPNFTLFPFHETFIDQQ